MNTIGQDYVHNKMATSQPSWIWSRKTMTGICKLSFIKLSVCQVWTRLLNACPRNGWGRVQHRVSFYNLNGRQSTSRPSLIRSQNQISCKCMPLSTVLVPCLSKIWPNKSEKWLETHLSKKMAASRPSWMWAQKNNDLLICHHSLSVCQGWTTSVNACPINGWGRVQHRVF